MTPLDYQELTNEWPEPPVDWAEVESEEARDADIESEGDE